MTVRKRKPSRPWRVLDSPIHGRGVFATRTIRKGETILEYRGRRTTYEEACEAPDTDGGNPYHTFLFSLDDGRVIDANVRGNAARWINHSCAPNCDTYEDDSGRVYIEALRTIRAGEELAYDYRLQLDGSIGPRVLLRYVCRCGSRRCRGTMLAGRRAATASRRA